MHDSSIFVTVMALIKNSYSKLSHSLKQQGVTLIAVSKTKPAADILEAYALGQLDFGENYVQELVDKHDALPKDIRWHFIGHLQRNKVKYIAQFVHLIHGVDSESLLLEINKQGKKINRVIPCLLQVHIAKEETKFGLDESELESIIKKMAVNPEAFSNISIMGLMGMASFTDDANIVKKEFDALHSIFKKCKDAPELKGKCTILSMGMSGDYEIAIASGSNMVRIGSLIFGERNYEK